MLTKRNILQVKLFTLNARLCLSNFFLSSAVISIIYKTLYKTVFFLAFLSSCPKAPRILLPVVVISHSLLIPVAGGIKGEAMQTRPPNTWNRHSGQRRPTLHTATTTHWLNKSFSSQSWLGVDGKILYPVFITISDKFLTDSINQQSNGNHITRGALKNWQEANLLLLLSTATACTELNGIMKKKLKENRTRT